MARGKRVLQRRIRILEALQGRWLDEVYFLDARFRRDLRREAARGDRSIDDILVTTELLEFFESSLGSMLAAKEVPLLFGVAPASAFALGAPGARMVSFRPRTSKGSEEEEGDKVRVDIVVIVPGNLGSTLCDIGGAPPVDPGCIWLNPAALLKGRFRDLALAPYDGTENDADRQVCIRATGAVQGLFDMMQRHLTWNNIPSVVFPYDWRKEIDGLPTSPAIQLKELIGSLGDQGYRVHIVTHSLGGTVARRALHLLRCDSSEEAVRQIVGNLILLGPANYGTFVGALALAGALDQLPLFKFFPEIGPDKQAVLKTFTALYQILPWDADRFPSLGTYDLRAFDFWQGLIERPRFDRAFFSPGPTWAARINTQFLNDRTTVIVGYHPLCKTAGGVTFNWQKRMVAAEDFPIVGDGWVPHISSILENTQAYIANGVDHLRLPMAPRVVRAVVRLLLGDSEIGLPEYDRVALNRLGKTG